MKKYLIVLLAFIISSCSNGQTTEAENGIDDANKVMTTEQAKILFNKTKFFPNSTQLAIALIKNEKVHFIGIERKNDTIRLVENYNNVFEIGSITKVFTSTLLSNFVIDQKIKLDDPIQDHIDFKINSNSKITFKQLANHTSGLPRLPSNLDLFLVDQNNPYKDYDKEKLKAYLTKEVKLNQEPGIKYEYSNLGAGILGFELSRISNASYESLLQEKIFEKYKMKSSTTNKPSIASKLVKGLKPTGEATSNWDFDALASAGALFSTVEDLSLFAKAQFNNDNKALRLTQKPTFRINDNMQIGLGWHIITLKGGGEWLWHNGGTGGYTSSMALDVEQKNGIIILSNVSAFHKKMGNIDLLGFELLKTLDE